MPSRTQILRGNETYRFPSTFLSFALVIEEAGNFRNLVMALLREHGWLVHGTNRVEDAFRILAHIPYELILLDSELSGMCGIDFIHTLQNSREWRTISVVVITGSSSPNFASQVAECGAFLVRRARWEEDLFEFLAAKKGNSHVGELVRGRESCFP